MICFDFFALFLYVWQFYVDLQAKKSIASHLCTVSDFAIEMFDVLDAINYQSYNDFVLRVGEWEDVAQTHVGLNKQCVLVGWLGGGEVVGRGWPIALDTIHTLCR